MKVEAGKTDVNSSPRKDVYVTEEEKRRWAARIDIPLSIWIWR
jgi:hypothetical protein